MKLKFLFLALCIVCIVKPVAFADEIIESSGNVIPCKIETVMDGLIEYRQNGLLYSFTREYDSPMFTDYVIVRDSFRKRKSLSRHSGRVIIKNMWNTVIVTEDKKMDIPFYRVKFIGIYKPQS